MLLAQQIQGPKPSLAGGPLEIAASLANFADSSAKSAWRRLAANKKDVSTDLVTVTSHFDSVFDDNAKTMDKIAGSRDTSCRRHL